MGLIKRGPDMSAAAKSGPPAMTTLKGTVPVSVPTTRGTPGFTGDVSVTTGGDASALDKLPDARGNAPAAGAAAGTEAKPAGAQPADANAAAAKPADPNAKAADAPATPADPKAQKKKKKDKKVKPQPAATTPDTTATPASTTTPAPKQNPPGQP
jgi:hypothetical protein